MRLNQIQSNKNILNISETVFPSTSLRGCWARRTMAQGDGFGAFARLRGLGGAGEALQHPFVVGFRRSLGHRCGMQALELFGQLPEHLQPNRYTYTALFDAVVKGGERGSEHIFAFKLYFAYLGLSQCYSKNC